MSKWLIDFSKRKHAKLTIFAFPYAGGTGNFVRGWQNDLPQDVRLLGIQAPGREERFEERPIDRVEEKIEQLYPVIAPYLDSPFIFMGHSNGALTAFELAKHLLRTGETENFRHFVLSAKRAPHLKLNRPRFSDLNDQQILDELSRHSFQKPHILKDWDIMKNFIPMIRADYGLADNYTFNASAPLDIPATLIAGSTDVDSPVDDVWGWEHYFTGHVKKIVLNADHAFVKTHAQTYLQHLYDITQTELNSLSMMR